MLKLLSKRCCEIAWFPLPCHFKSLETFVLNVLPNVLRLLSIPSLGRLINFFSVTTNKRNNSLSTQSEEKRGRVVRRKRQSNDRRSKKYVKTGGRSPLPPPPRLSRTSIFIRPWQVYTDCIFHFEAIAGAVANAG